MTFYSLPYRKLVVFVNPTIDFVCPFLPAANEAAGSNGFSRVILLLGGSHVAITHDTLNFTTQGPRPYTGLERPPHTMPPPRVQGPVHVQTCSNWNSLQEPLYPNTCSNLFILEHIWSASEQLTPCFNPFLLTL